MTQDELVAAVKAHALANYEKDGWDYIVECYSDEGLRDLIGRCQTPESAIAKVRKTASLLDERRQEVRAESGEY